MNKREGKCRYSIEKGAVVMRRIYYGIGIFLKDDNGKVHVYRGDGETVYEYTNIQVSSLPEAVQREVEEGKYIKSEVELYSFLENYSS